MYQLVYKEVGKIRYKPLRTKKFRNYKFAYYYLGSFLQENDTLSWSYSLKYMMDGYDRKKLIRRGNHYFRRKNICFKIIQS